MSHISQIRALLLERKAPRGRKLNTYVWARFLPGQTYDFQIGYYHAYDLTKRERIPVAERKFFPLLTVTDARIEFADHRNWGVVRAVVRAFEVLGMKVRVTKSQRPGDPQLRWEYRFIADYFSDTPYFDRRQDRFVGTSLTEVRDEALRRRVNNATYKLRKILQLRKSLGIAPPACPDAIRSKHKDRYAAESPETTLALIENTENLTDEVLPELMERLGTLRRRFLGHWSSYTAAYLGYELLYRNPQALRHTLQCATGAIRYE